MRVRKLSLSDILRTNRDALLWLTTIPPGHFSRLRTQCPIMAKLQVGDITIDGRNVTIGPQVPIPAPARPPPDGASVAHAVSLLDRVPLSTGALLSIGGILAVVGTVVNVMLAAWNDPLGALMHGGILAPLGAGVVVAGVAKAWIRHRPRIRHAAALGGEAEPYLLTLRRILVGPDTRHTIAWIAGQTGWADESIVHALALLRDRGELLEELDLERGEFYYQAVQPSPAPRSLDVRVGDLTS
jgi:hypothetical protein